MLLVISGKAAPFRQFAMDTRSRAGESFWEGTLDLRMSTAEAMNELARRCELVYQNATGNG